MTLTLSAYDQKESSALLDLSNDHIRAFAPVTFIQAGYPIRVDDERQLIRYVDTMQELSNPRGYYDEMLYSSDEARLVVEICDVVADLSERSFGRRIRPWMGPLATIKLFRAIEGMSAVVGRKLKVFELGPGSGYLGAMLLKNGHSYASMDITQGFYLWQSRLMETLAREEFLEGAEEQAWPYSRPSRVSHIPWWDYVRMARFPAPQFDVIACDHALGEMHAYALRYVAQLSRLMLEDAPNGMVIYCSIGAPNISSEEAVRLNFERVGLERIVSGEVTAFCPRGREVSERLRELGTKIPFFNPGGQLKRHRGRDFMKLAWDEAPPSYEMYKFMGYDTPMELADNASSGTPQPTSERQPNRLSRVATRINHFFS